MLIVYGHSQTPTSQEIYIEQLGHPFDTAQVSTI